MSELSDIKNYNTSFDNSPKNNYILFQDLLFEYLLSIHSKVKLSKQKYLKYVITNGMKLITQIFNLTLLYTKNCMTTYNTVKYASKLYIECCENLNEINNHIVFKMTPKEATMYVYRKTIYILQKEKKIEEPTINILNTNKIRIDICNDILIQLIKNMKDTKEIPQLLNNYKETYTKFLLREENETQSFSDLSKVFELNLISNSILQNNISQEIYTEIAKEYFENKKEFNRNEFMIYLQSRLS